MRAWDFTNGPTEGDKISAFITEKHEFQVSEKKNEQD